MNKSLRHKVYSSKYLSNQVSFKNYQMHQVLQDEKDNDQNQYIKREKIMTLQSNLQLQNNCKQNGLKSDRKLNQKYYTKRISNQHLGTPSINRLQTSNKQLTKNLSNSKINSFQSENISEDGDRKYLRKTCKMFQLDYKINNPKTVKTMKNLVINIQNNKFNQIQDNQNNYRGKKDKSFIVAKTSMKNIKNVKESKENQKTSIDGQKYQIRLNNVPENGITPKFSKRQRKQPRKSRFSGRIGKIQMEEYKKLPICDKTNKFSQKQIKNQKFIELKELTSVVVPNKQSYLKTLPWMKWKKCSKNTEYSKNTQKITAYHANKDLEQHFKKLYQQQIEQKQQQLRRFNMLRTGIRKLKSNEKIIQGLRNQKKQRIENFFEDLQQKVLYFNGFANGQKSNSSDIQNINQELRIGLEIMGLNIAQK